MENKLNPLHKFYLDQESFQAVKTYVIEHLKELAVNKALNGDSTTGIKEAHIAINNAFDSIEEEYSPEKKKNLTSSE